MYTYSGSGFYSTKILRLYRSGIFLPASEDPNLRASATPEFCHSFATAKLRQWNAKTSQLFFPKIHIVTGKDGFEGNLNWR